MKRSAIFAVIASGALSIVVACSSSSGGSSSGPPSCQGATGTTGAGTSACNSCLESNCGSQISSVEGACSAFVSCYSGCQCTDSQCLLNCVTMKIDSTCQNSYGPLQTCQSNNCSMACAQTTIPTDGGLTE
jgi:hypothetical protein